MLTIQCVWHLTLTTFLLAILLCFQPFNTFNCKTITGMCVLHLCTVWCKMTVWLYLSSYYHIHVSFELKRWAINVSTNIVELMYVVKYPAGRGVLTYSYPAWIMVVMTIAGFIGSVITRTAWYLLSKMSVMPLISLTCACASKMYVDT